MKDKGEGAGRRMGEESTTGQADEDSGSGGFWSPIPPFLGSGVSQE